MSRVGVHFLGWSSPAGKVWLLFFLVIAITLSPHRPLFAQAPPPPANKFRSQVASPIQTSSADSDSPEDDYRIGAEDSLEIAVFEAPDLARTVRVSRRGEITLPPLGVVKVGGLTSRHLELALEDLLRPAFEAIGIEGR